MVTFRQLSRSKASTDEDAAWKVYQAKGEIGLLGFYQRDISATAPKLLLGIHVMGFLATR